MLTPTRLILIGLAMWNTAVASVNMLVLPLFVPAGGMVYMTPLSQILPVAIPLAWLALTFKPVRRVAWAIITR